jgi:hypothetical protein
MLVGLCKCVLHYVNLVLSFIKLAHLFHPCHIFQLFLIMAIALGDLQALWKNFQQLNPTMEQKHQVEAFGKYIQSKGKEKPSDSILAGVISLFAQLEPVAPSPVLDMDFVKTWSLDILKPKMMEILGEDKYYDLVAPNKFSETDELFKGKSSKDIYNVFASLDTFQTREKARILAFMEQMSIEEQTKIQAWIDKNKMSQQIRWQRHGSLYTWCGDHTFGCIGSSNIYIGLGKASDPDKTRRVMLDESWSKLPTFFNCFSLLQSDFNNVENLKSQMSKEAQEEWKLVLQCRNMGK